MKYVPFNEVPSNEVPSNEVPSNEVPDVDPNDVPYVDRIFHELAGPVFRLMIDQLEVEEPGQVQDDGHQDDQSDEVEWRLKIKFDKMNSQFTFFARI
jgi:hypothetical protein